MNALVNVQTFSRTAFQAVIDWISPNETIQPIDIHAVRIEKGDALYFGNVEIQVIATGESPYLQCPPEYADYGNGGEWAYIYCPATNEVDWTPVGAIIAALATSRAEVA